MGRCPVTDFDGADVAQGGGDYTRVTCRPLGGSYRISGSAAPMVKEMTAIAKAKLARWIVDQNRLGAEPMVTTPTLSSLIKLPRLGVMDRLDRLYRYD